MAASYAPSLCLRRSVLLLFLFAFMLPLALAQSSNTISTDTSTDTSTGTFTSTSVTDTRNFLGSSSTDSTDSSSSSNSGNTTDTRTDTSTTSTDTSSSTNTDNSTSTSTTSSSPSPTPNTGKLGPQVFKPNWHAGHASALVYPYILHFGGTESTQSIQDPFSDSVLGSSDIQAWNLETYQWYLPIPLNNSYDNSSLGSLGRPQKWMSAVSLPSEGKMLTYCWNVTDDYDDIQIIDAIHWTWTSSSSSSTVLPASRVAASAFAISNSTIYMHGGASVGPTEIINSSVTNNLYSLNADSLEWSTHAIGPSLAYHTACWLSGGSDAGNLVIFGGGDTYSPQYNNLHIYNLDGASWTLYYNATGAGGIPSPRRAHTATCMGNQMVVFGGGMNDTAVDDDVWVLDATVDPWQWVLKTTNKISGPGARLGHTAILNDTNIYIWGGFSSSAINDVNVYVLNTTNWQWTIIPPSGLQTTITITSSPTSTNSNTTSATENDSIVPVKIIIASVIASVGTVLTIAIAVFVWRRQHTEETKTRGHSAIISTDEDLLPPTSKKSEAYNNNSYHSQADSGRPMLDPDNVAEFGMVGLRSESRHGSLSGASDHYFPEAPIMPNSAIRDEKDITAGAAESTSLPADTEKSTNGFNGEAGRRRESSRTEKSINADSKAENIIVPLRGANRSMSSLIIAPAMGVNLADSPTGPLTTYDEEEDEADNWTFASSLSFDPSEAREGRAPIRYIPPVNRSATTNSRQSVNPSRTISDRSVYGSSTQTASYGSSSVPVGRPITPPPLSLTLPLPHHDTSPPIHPRPMPSSGGLNMIDSMSPLDRLVTLSSPTYEQGGGSPRTSMSTTAGTIVDSTVVEAGSLATGLSSETGRSLVNPGDAQDDSSDPNSTEKERTNILQDVSADSEETEPVITSFTGAQITDPAFAGLVTALPPRYHAQTVPKPFVGPTNTIIFCLDTSTSEPVAVKAFGRREAWERECQVLTRLKSDYVVDLREVLTIENSRTASVDANIDERSRSIEPAMSTRAVRYLTVMDCLDETLATVLRNSRKDWRERLQRDRELRPTSPLLGVQNVRTIIRAIIEALIWCHSRGIAFCDLKPSNVMHNRGDDRWRLIDFEGSRRINEELVGVITARYCPPEVARATTHGLESNGVVATPDVDMWALGCMIYELHTSRPLFPPSISDATILHFISHPSPATPALLNGLRWNQQHELEIPEFEKLAKDEEARSLIMRLLSRDPVRRGSVSGVLKSPYMDSIYETSSSPRRSLVNVGHIGYVGASEELPVPQTAVVCEEEEEVGREEG